MDDYYQCYNFFKECTAFVIKHKNFLAACKRIRDNNEKLEPKMYDALVDSFAIAEKDMNSTCNEHRCIVDYFQNADDEMESDISDLEESDDSDQSEKEDDEKDVTDTSSTDESENEDNENESDEEDNNSVDEMEYDDDMADFFETDQCCIHELLKPFYETLIETKQFDVVKKIQIWKDEYEEKCLRFEKFFSPHEKDECAIMMKEILSNYDKKGSDYLKLCESKYIKLLATYCKDVIDEKTGKELFGQNYAKLNDLEIPLNKKRKMFTKKDVIRGLLNHIRNETLPILNEYLVRRHDHILKKIINLGFSSE